MMRARWMVVGLALCLGGCASTRVQTEWRDARDAAGPVQRLAVFVAGKDESLRPFAEGQIALKLADENRVSAVSGQSLGLGADPAAPATRERLARDGFDAALLARLVSSDTTRLYHPPETNWVGGAWGPGYRAVHGYFPFTYTTPGYTSETTRVVVELLLYRLPEGRMVWNAVTETRDPDSTAELVDGVRRAVRDGLRKQGLLLPKP